MLIPVNQNAFILQDIDYSSIKNAKPTYLTFLLIKADWCPHCVNYMPIYEQYSVQYPDVNFLVLESTTNPEIIKWWSNLIDPVFTCEGFPMVVLYIHEKAKKVVENRFALDEIIKEYS